ncbi:hypothetical protein PFISCL1PPCAC_10592 [Pristionchus fissidentatus]|uniref:t-SNARE coiled-coil homology domain-containing protein n=1 Tax=Pristionchus fissidentatus TaxID=1538716 RepID=A0AAV5VI12_9BILA|nr:hypothetical protein PFISCL1PPCAC_10592 [Pristionchus fissidentatus]
MTSMGSTVPGVSRNVTEVFLLLRSNAQQDFAFRDRRGKSSKVRFGSLKEEEMSLVSLEEGGEHADTSFEQPMWIHTADEVEYEMGRIKTKIGELSIAQQKHLSRTSFGDDKFEELEERRIEALTDQITKMISHAQRLVSGIGNDRPPRENRGEQRLRVNVTNALLFSLSHITSEFKKHQTSYLTRIRKRSQNVDDFLIAGLGGETSHEMSLLDAAPDQEYSMAELQMIMNNESIVQEREKEVLAVNQSIVELNSLFKDLSAMVVEQGTILDRIDHNIENTSIRVSKATESVQSAYRAQRGDKKMQCIMCLAIAIIILILLLIATKF